MGYVNHKEYQAAYTPSGLSGAGMLSWCCFISTPPDHTYEGGLPRIGVSAILDPGLPVAGWWRSSFSLRGDAANSVAPIVRVVNRYPHPGFVKYLY
jgi:hypothetical protein